MNINKFLTVLFFVLILSGVVLALDDSESDSLVGDNFEIDFNDLDVTLTIFSGGDALAEKSDDSTSENTENLFLEKQFSWGKNFILGFKYNKNGVDNETIPPVKIRNFLKKKNLPILFFNRK